MRKPGEWSLREARREASGFLRVHRWDYFQLILATLGILAAIASALRLGYHPLFVGFVSGLLLATMTFLMLYPLYERSRAKWLGNLAERWTESSLQGLSKRGFSCVHGLRLNGGDIDHIVIGPSGIFAIETKYRSSQSLRKDGLMGLRRNTRQFRRRVDSLARFIESRAGYRLEIQPILVLWGPWVSFLRVNQFDGVRILVAPDEISLDARPSPTFTQSVMTEVLEALSSYEIEQLKYEKRSLARVQKKKALT